MVIFLDSKQESKGFWTEWWLANIYFTISTCN